MDPAAVALAGSRGDVASDTINLRSVHRKSFGSEMMASRLARLAAVALAAVTALAIIVSVVGHSEPGRSEQPGVLEVMISVADWQLAHPSSRQANRWPEAVFATGLLALGEIAPQRGYLDAVRRAGESVQWRPGPGAGPGKHGSANYGMVSTYAHLYMIDKDAKVIDPSIAFCNSLVEQPDSVPLLSSDRGVAVNAAMADALFFAPPSLAAMTKATGDQRYVDLADQMFTKSTDYLYDPGEHLFYEHKWSFEAREPNGQKQFWSRANGWVLAALARMMEDIPASDPNRPRYAGLFTELADRVVSLQGSDGYWRSSLLDPDSVPNPESSGTALFTYGLAWGVNHGLLDPARYTPAARRGWAALVNAMQPDGMLGWVQPQAGEPGPTAQDATETYGTGALLLAGSEMYRLQ
jgi:unsaturated rhamnogalacturonyl hydrolase